MVVKAKLKRPSAAWPFPTPGISKPRSKESAAKSNASKSDSSEVLEFHDKQGQRFHDEFQNWRRNHQHGYLLSFTGNNRAKLHEATSCWHLGGYERREDSGEGSLTNKRKVCADSLDKLISWAKKEGVTIQNCSHCFKHRPVNSVDTSDPSHLKPSNSAKQRMNGWIERGAPVSVDEEDLQAKLKSFTSADYVGALRRVEPTNRQLEMLRVHLAAPDHTITVRHLARAVGFAKWNAANLHYGKFAGKLCNELNVTPTTNLSVLVEFFKAPGSEYELCLRPSVIEALRELGIGGQGTWSFQEELGIEEPLVEGASFTVQVSAFERNPVARQKCVAHYGTSCSVCGFNFGSTYGSSADDYIHVHHLKQLASIGEEYVIDPIKDLRPVCANCHAVIHLRQLPYSIEEVKGMLHGDVNATLRLNGTMQKRAAP